MSLTEELYQDIILDHSKSPRNFRRPAGEDGFNRVAEGDNPLCGDSYTVHLKLDGDGGTIEDVVFHGDGCAISKASASVMTHMVKGRTVEEARALIQDLKDAVNGPPTEEVDILDFEGDIGAFASLRRYPTRVKCGTLAWNTLRAALDGRDVTVTTE